MEAMLHVNRDANCMIGLKIVVNWLNIQHYRNELYMQLEIVQPPLQC